MRSKYLNFKNLNVIRTICPPIYINSHTYEKVHPLCRDKVEPSPYLQELLEKNKHLIDGVVLAVAIRFSRIKHSDGLVEPNQHVDEHALKEFNDLIERTDGRVFVACDILDYKHTLRDKFGSKISFVDDVTVISCTTNSIDAPTPYLEFFLLSMCPHLVLTGGPRDMSNFSTFGYMAAVYGGKPFNVIWNA